MGDRIIGILGGMGPEATVDLYTQIIRLTPAHCDQDHLRVLIYSNPGIPDRTRAILEGGDDPFPELLGSARKLEAGGAGVILIPCNAAHYFLPALQNQLRTPILDMIRETCLDLKNRVPSVRKVGLLAATGTVRAGIYSRVFAPEGIEILTPDPEEQILVHSAIQQVKAGVHDSSTRACFEGLGERLTQAGAEAVVLGCTEIPLAFNQNAVRYPTVNPTKVLAKAAVMWALGEKR